MNEQFDPYHPALALWRQLGIGDKCRFIDQCIIEAGEFIPIPALADQEFEAQAWCASQPKSRQSILWREITKRLSADDLRKATAFLEKLIAEREAQKAEPPAG